MLTRAQEKLILSLHHKNGRRKSGQCLVEGAKVIETAGDAVEFVFAASDSDRFDELVTTEAPQLQAAVARVPEWTVEDVTARKTILVLDGVQDPGNVGAILRLCLGFDASLVLVDSADVTNPKVVRSSVGALFQVPWMRVAREEAVDVIAKFERKIFRLEKTSTADSLSAFTEASGRVLIAGSEGTGIHLPVEGSSVAIDHNPALESLNVGHAVAIALAR